MGKTVPIDMASFSNGGDYKVLKGTFGKPKFTLSIPTIKYYHTITYESVLSIIIKGTFHL